MNQLVGRQHSKSRSNGQGRYLRREGNLLAEPWAYAAVGSRAAASESARADQNSSPLATTMTLPPTWTSICPSRSCAFKRSNDGRPIS